MDECQRTRIRNVISWFVVLASLGLGVIVLGIATQLRDFAGRRIIYEVAMAGIAGIVGSTLAVHKPRLAWKFDLLAACTFILTGLYLFPILKAIVLIAAILSMLIPGIFWFETARSHWPTLQSQGLLPGSVLLPIAVAVVLVSVVGGSLALFSLSLPWFNPNVDCGGQTLLNENGEPRGRDFTAIVVFVPPRFLALRFYDRTLWAIAQVENRFSEPKTIPSTIILRGNFSPDDVSRQYFVEGRRHNQTRLSDFLPIVEPSLCGHTKRIERAQLELRILTGIPSTSATRIIGGVYNGYGDQGFGVVGAKVLVHGPHQDATLVTDGEGIFETTDLPPGRYSIELIRPNKPAQRTLERYVYDLKGGQVGEATFVSN